MQKSYLVPWLGLGVGEAAENGERGSYCWLRQGHTMAVLEVLSLFSTDTDTPNFVKVN